MAFGDPLSISQTEVMRFNANIYYIGDTDLVNDYGDPIYALYQQSLPYNDPANPPTELVQGVENMRVSFGIRNNFGNLSYVTADQINFVTSQIESVRVGLLMTSWDRISQQDDENTYVLAGQPIPASTSSGDGTTHPSDRRFRLVFNTTINVRNR